MSTGRSDLTTIDALPWPVEIRPHAKARSVRLRIDEARGRLVLTHPARMARRAAVEWAAGQRQWAEKQLSGMAPARPFADGMTIPFMGKDVRIAWSPSSPRTPIVDQDVIRCGGPIASLPGRIERFLKSAARDRLSARTAEIAARAGVEVKSVSVADTRSRWGSCSSDGAIRYSWRLILAPPAILDWVVAHEVAHRRHMNHGPEFKALEAALFDGNIAAARALLRRLGPGLKRVGRPL